MREDSPEYRKVKDRKAFDQQNALLASMSSTSGVGAVELASGKQEMKTLLILHLSKRLKMLI